MRYSENWIQGLQKSARAVGSCVFIKFRRVSRKSHQRHLCSVCFRQTPDRLRSGTLSARARGRCAFTGHSECAQETDVMRNQWRPGVRFNGSETTNNNFFEGGRKPKFQEETQTDVKLHTDSGLSIRI